MNIPPNDARHFVHKKLLKAAVGFIPGGSTALSVFSTVKSLVGGRGGSSAVTTSCATEADFQRLVATRSWTDVARICGTTVQRAQERFRPGSVPSLQTSALPQTRRLIGRCGSEAEFRQLVATLSWPAVASACGTTISAAQARFRPPQRPASVPPANPVRQIAIQRKPITDVVNISPRPRARIPFVMPRVAPHPISNITPAVGAPAMPIHRKIGGFLGLGGGGSQCLPGTVAGPGGVCMDLSAALPGGDPLFQVGVGATMGRYGPAYQGNSRMIRRTTCLPGDLVGDDGLCYSRGSLTNKERMWPRGTRPLLTGGEMNAIRVAARAGGRLERTQKRLQKMGMMKKSRR